GDLAGRDPATRIVSSASGVGSSRTTGVKGSAGNAGSVRASAGTMRPNMLLRRSREDRRSHRTLCPCLGLADGARAAAAAAEATAGCRAIAPTTRPASESARIAHLLRDDTRKDRFREESAWAWLRDGGLWARLCDGGLWVKLARQMAGQWNNLGELLDRQWRPDAKAKRDEGAGHAAAPSGRAGYQSPPTDAGHHGDHVSG